MYYLTHHVYFRCEASDVHYTRHTYLKDAPDDKSTSIKKMALLFGIAGGLRIEELTLLERKNVEITDDGFLKVRLEDSKTGPRHFFVHPSTEEHLNAVAMYKKYLMLLPKDVKSDRVWLRMEAGKIQDRPIGKKMMADITKEIARFLNLEDPESDTSHSIRRTGATLLAEKSVTTEALRQYGGWKNASTAQVYIESTASNKKRLAESVLDSTSAPKIPKFSGPAIAVSPPVSTATALGSSNILFGGNFENCVFHVHQ